MPQNSDRYANMQEVNDVAYKQNGGNVKSRREGGQAKECGAAVEEVWAANEGQCKEVTKAK